MFWRLLLASALSFFVYVAWSQRMERNLPPGGGQEGVGQANPVGGRNAQIGDPAVRESSITVERDASGVKGISVALTGGDGQTEQVPFLGGLPGGTIRFASRDPADAAATPKSVTNWAQVDGNENARAATLAPNLTVEWSVTQAPNDRLAIRYRFKNAGDAPQTIAYDVSAPTGVRSEIEGDVHFVYGSPSATVSLETRTAKQISAKDLAATPWSSSSAVAWVGALNARFLAVLSSRPNPDGSSIVASALGAVETAPDGIAGVVATFRSVPLTVAAGKEVIHDYDLYVGSRDPRSLIPHANLDLSSAGVFDVPVTDRFRLQVDTGTGSVTGLYLRNIDRIAGGTDEERTDYRLLYPAFQGPSTLGLELQEQDARESRALGFSSQPWAIRTEDAPGGLSVVLERVANGLRVRKILRAPPASDPLAAPQLGENASDQLGARHLQCSVEIQNLEKRDREIYYYIFGPTAIDTEDLRYGIYFAGAEVGSGGQIFA
ncbi:MAG: hypothetical protein AAF517_18715, partial [Planctomycetota bacterium]